MLIVAWLGYLLMTKKCGVEPVKNNEPVLSASFNCEDGTSFVTEITGGKTAKINYSNNTVLANRVDWAGNRYENNNYLYVFAGEEVTVTDKVTKKTTTCEQPTDKNKEPVNFGDAGEGGGEKIDLSASVTANITGKWQSTTDAKFIRVFNNDGTVNDFYNNKVTATGTWKAYTKDKPLSNSLTSTPLEDDTVYVQSTMSGSQSGNLNFKVEKLTPESLELIDVEHNTSATVFTSVK